MLGRKKSSSQIDAAVGASVNYEVTIADLAMRSQKRAWFVAGSAILMAVLLASTLPDLYHCMPRSKLSKRGGWRCCWRSGTC